MVPDMFCNFYVVKNHKIVNNSATTETREKVITYLESLQFKKLFENNPILLNKISHRFVVTTKLYLVGERAPLSLPLPDINITSF